MAFLNAYLYIYGNDGSAERTTHRDIASIRDRWFEVRGRERIVGVLHVSFASEELPHFNIDFDTYSGMLFVTDSARSALPKELRTEARHPVSVSGSYGLFLLKSGWGYEAQFPELEVGSVSDTVAKPEERSLAGWVANFRSIGARAEVQELESFGIYDEKSYREIEDGLDGRQRVKAAMFRFAGLTSQKMDPVTLMENIAALPTWALQTSIRDLNLTDGIRNAFERRQIKVVADIQAYSPEQILEFQGIGKVAFRKIGEKILAVCSQAPAYFSAIQAVNTVGSSPVAPPPNENFTFVEEIQYAFTFLPENWVKIFRFRSGFELAKRYTLEDTGTECKLTRERVRQIETKSIDAINEKCQLQKKLLYYVTEVRKERVLSTPLSGLEHINAWFRGVDNYRNSFEYALQYFSAIPLYIIDLDGIAYLSDLSQGDWEKKTQLGKRLLLESCGDGKKESELRLLVLDLLDGKCSDLTTEFWYEVSRLAHFIDDGENDRTLIGYGESAFALSMVVLAQSSTPLHYSEITELVNERFGKSYDERRVHVDLGDQALLFDRGTYGLMKHYPLSRSESSTLVDLIEDYVLESPSTKQWHAYEFMEYLSSVGVPFLDRIDQYIINIALRDSTLLHSLRRRVWGVRDIDVDTGAPRIDTYQAVIQILDRAGGPLSAKQIRFELHKHRGTSEFFQLHPDARLYKVSVTEFGLFERDIPISLSDLEMCCTTTKGMLEDRNKGIHISEIGPILKARIGAVQPVQDFTFLFCHLQVVHGLRVDLGDYVYLPSWESSRRYSVREAIARVVSDSGLVGIAIDTLYVQVRKLLERDVPNSRIGQAIATTGAIYDKFSLRWKLPDSSGDTDDE